MVSPDSTDTVDPVVTPSKFETKVYDEKYWIEELVNFISRVPLKLLAFRLLGVIIIRSLW